MKAKTIILKGMDRNSTAEQLQGRLWEVGGLETEV